MEYANAVPAVSGKALGLAATHNLGGGHLDLNRCAYERIHKIIETIKLS